MPVNQSIGGASGLPDSFNAASYLAANPDVAAAVSRGEMTAAQHYSMYGYKEGRQGTGSSSSSGRSSSDE